MSGRIWNLIWEEHFDGSEINKNTWGYEIGKIRNNELQYYTDRKENAYLQDSCLVIEGRKESFMDSGYTSASLNTRGKKSFLYGKIEMYAKLPYGQGIWPAFWTLGENIREVGWPKCGEIDIMELVGGTGNKELGDDKVLANIHSPSKIPPIKNNSYILKQGKYADDFHIIGCVWTEKNISWYVDGDMYCSADISDIEAFHKPQYILVNLAIGGNWPGDPDETTMFPQKYYIDYIRYYD